MAYPSLSIGPLRLSDPVLAAPIAGFTDLVVCLKSHSRWASVHHGWLRSRNPSPKPRHLDAYERWIGAVHRT